MNKEEALLKQMSHIQQNELRRVRDRYKDQIQNQANTIREQRSKIQLLKELILLTHEQVSHEQVGDVQLRQWNEYVAQFPEEG